MGSRRKGRILAMQALYAWEVGHPPLESLLTFPWIDTEQASRFDDSTQDFARMLVAGVLESLDDVDDEIRAHLENWDFDRISRVDLALLRLGAYSLMFQKEIPATVTIDEAIEVAKEYSGDDAYRFINGILDGVRKSPTAMR